MKLKNLKKKNSKKKKSLKIKKVKWMLKITLKQLKHLHLNLRK